MVIDGEKKDRLEKEFPPRKARIELYGEEVIEKTVSSSGNNGRIYLPVAWIGKKVKIVRC